MLISEAFERYRQDIIVFSNQSPKTEETHTCALKRVLEFAGDINLEDFDHQQIRNWKVWLDKGRSEATVREYIVRLRVVLRHMQKIGVLCTNYELIPVPKRLQRVPEFLTKEQVAELIRVVLLPSRGYPEVNKIRNAAMVSMFYASGIRASELLNMNISDLRENDSFTVIGKGRKPRLCFFDARAKDLINRYLELRTDNSPALFVSGDKRLSKSVMQLVFANISRKVGYRVHAHILRHSYATDLLLTNTNMRHVQVLLGHSSLTTTQMYTHVVDEDLRRVYMAGHRI